MREPQVGEFVWFRPEKTGGGVAIEVEDIGEEDGSLRVYGKIDFSHNKNFEAGKRIHLPLVDIDKVENARIYRFNRRCTAVASEPEKFSTKIELIRELPSPADIELPEALTSQVDIVAFRPHHMGISVIGEKDGKYGLFEVANGGVGQVRVNGGSHLYWAFFTNQNLLHLALRWNKNKGNRNIVPLEEFEVDLDEMVDPWEHDHWCATCKTSHEKPCGA